MNLIHYTGQPESKTIVYNLNIESGYYERFTSPPGFEKLPPELKVEETRRPEQIHSKLICRGRIKNGRYTFFTGLLPVTNSLFFGDHFHPNEKVKNSFILFEFSEGNQILTINYLIIS